MYGMYSSKQIKRVKAIGRDWEEGVEEWEKGKAEEAKVEVEYCFAEFYFVLERAADCFVFSYAVFSKETLLYWF